MSKLSERKIKPSGQGAKQLEQHSSVFSALGRRLGEAASVRRVADIVVESADQLLGWDSCAVDLYSPDTDISSSVLAMDIIDGRRREVREGELDMPPSPRLRQVMADGAQIILRNGTVRLDADSVPFGDTNRLSASLLYAPIRCDTRVKGVLSIQSYTANAYAQEDLSVLQALADHAALAIERVQSEGLLRRTEGLYRRAIGGAGAVPYVYDYRTRSYSFMGEGIEQLTGYSPKEISGDVWARIIQESAMSGEASGMDKTEAARRVKTGELRHWRCDMRIVTRDGKSRWISDASVQNLDEAGRAIGSMGILEDITERKQAELSALALSNLGQGLIAATTPQEVARTLASVADSLFGWDAFGFYLYLPKSDEIQPLLYQDIINGQRADVTPPRSELKPSVIDRRVIEKGAELILREGPILTMNADAIAFGDKSRPSASVMRVPVRMRARQVSGITAVHSYSFRAYTEKDLNVFQTLADCCGVALERIWADEARRQSESQFRLVWETSADGMRLTDREGIMLRVNQAYCRMVEKSREELEGQPLAVVQQAARSGEVSAKHTDRFDARTIKPHAEKEVTLWNGRKVWFELSNSMLELPDKPPLLFTVFRDITRRKESEAELSRMHGQLLDVSRQAGMAEVATSVLHNVGNVLNSVNISSSLAFNKVKNSKVVNLAKAVSLMQSHAADLGAFLTGDPKGKQVLGYLNGLAGHLGEEQKEILEELKSLSANVEHINEIVAMQQNYARVLGVLEPLPMAELVEDALRLNAAAMERHHVKVVREFSEVPLVLVDKHKVLQILINLIRNAKYALDDGGHSDKQITLRIEKAAHKTVRVSVIDNGVGIPPEHLTRIFEHGFTTRKQGHGFGLHNGAIAARELGGSLTARSDGPGHGASFILELPLEHKVQKH